MTTTISSKSFTTAIRNILGRPVRDLDEMSGSVGPAFVSDWHPRADVWVLQGLEQDEDWNVIVLRTAGVQVGGSKVWEVTGDGRVLGETRGLEAAMSIALEYVTAPAVAQVVMNELDPCGV